MMKSLKFEGSGREYFKIWIVNVLLTIVTLGFYYPWAKVRNRRYFYANSILDGRNFEYHATGKQLFIGFLVAMSLFVAYVVIKMFHYPLKISVGLFAVYNIINSTITGAPFRSGKTAWALTIPWWPRP